MMFDKRLMPVIVGVSQLADTTTLAARARSPLQLMVEAARLAGADSGTASKLLETVDSLAVVRLFSDTVPAFKSPFGRMENAAWSVAQRIGAKPQELIYAPQGGDTPQTLLTRACERIANGKSQVAMIVGAEALRTQLGARRETLQLDWHEDAPEPPNELGGPSVLYTQQEIDHGMRSAIAMYALFEQSLRAAKRQTPAQRRDALGRMFEPLAAVAAANPYATRRKGYDAAAITHVTDENPTIGFPYTKLMTANVYVDQAAAILVCSVQKADELGVPDAQRVYLHGSGEAHDQWYVTERASFHRSPAIKRVMTDTFSSTGLGIGDISCFDIYSCFGSAIQVASDELGIEATDPRGLTVTGGLPFFGGPGNNYVTHAIAEIVARLRRTPGKYGLITANGGLLTKHAAGLYSTALPQQPWSRPDPAQGQREIDAIALVPVLDRPEGEATIETYTVVHGKQGPEAGIIVGRLKENNRRFVANTPKDASVFNDLENTDSIGRPGSVAHADGRNVFTPGSAA
jgi:acetyl-CoA C-acetyltransferase